MKHLFVASLLAIAFLASGGFARAEEVDLNVACRTASELEHFSSVAEKILADQSISVNTGYELAVSQEGLGASCVVADANSFSFEQELEGKGQMSAVLYTDPSTRFIMSLIGYAPMDTDVPTMAILASSLPPSCQVVNKNQQYSCIHKDGCTCPVE